MVKNNSNYKEIILQLIKEKDSINLDELDKKGISRQTIRYNLRKLIKEGMIRTYVKVSDDKSLVFPKDDELYFAYIQNHFETPQDILKLINDMCSNEKNIASQAFETFINLHKERDHIEYGYYSLIPDNIKSEQEINRNIDEDKTNRAKKLAYALMSGWIPDLKEKVAYQLVMKKEFNDNIANYDESLIYEGKSIIDE